MRTIKESEKKPVNIIVKYMFLFLFLCLSLSCSSKSSKSPTSETKDPIPFSIPNGWYLSLNNSKIRLIQALEEKKAYKISFERPNKNEDDLYYIRIAESIYPQRKKVLKAVANPGDSWFFERLWWYEEFKEYLIPYALTSDTVNYYVVRYKKVKSSIKDELAHSQSKGSNKRRLEFSYSAKILDEGSVALSDQIVPQKRVVLRMRWYEYCGQPCGWGFEKSREIVFAGKRTVLSISGDGPTMKWTSSSQTPYGPNQWIRF